MVKPKQASKQNALYNHNADIRSLETLDRFKQNGEPITIILATTVGLKSRRMGQRLIGEAQY